MARRNFDDLTDKGWVSVALIPSIGSLGGESRAVMVGLLGTLRSMVAAGHQPDDYLLARFTDGRTKAVVLSDGTSSSDTLSALRNECGPVARAFNISVVSDAGCVLLRVVDLVSPGTLRVEQRGRWSNGLLECDEPVWVSETVASYSRDVRNSAIFAGSLGMTTGWLPNVDSSLLPAGVLSSPVW